MAWLAFYDTLADDPKTIDLKAEMGWDLDQTLGKLSRFMLWCQRHAEDGDLSKHKLNDNHLGNAVGCCPGEESKRFVEAMLKARWLEREPYFRVRNWWKWIGGWLQKKYSKTPDKWERVKALYLDLIQQPDGNRPETALTGQNKQNRTEQTGQNKKPSLGAGAPPGGPRPGRLEKKPLEGHQRVVDHLMETYKAKKSTKLLFGKAEGETVKRLLATYQDIEVLAFWDIYIGRAWSWKNRDGDVVKMPHSVLNFFTRVPEIIDDQAWKTRLKHYEAQVAHNPENVQKLAGLLSEIGAKGENG